ncbi:PREDICTED: uncharacterized protein LOC107189858 [Dufourea novaeangliae]|uniref:uncharacterized protein LOC107189858 n=1 Tax=Dufourea novaeangliae TaxID=178035 RepID=UPI000767A8CC|nr:PREDICTED: uncharacterized protein LOC107189858 [Dufourea novaeangliae]
MVNINPANVINLLVTALHISSIPPSPVNHREVELSEIIHTMILDSMNDVSFTTDYVTTLEYEDLTRPQECEFVQDDNIQENEEFTSNEFDDMCIPGESGNVDLSYKTRAVERDKQHLQLTSTEFVNRVKPYITMYNPNNVYNADENGFNLEIHSGRTLSYRGVKTIEASVQSVSSTTHSYTILPTISASGQLLSPLFMVLKETNGEFVPRVQENLFRSANVFVTASKSGKLTSHHFNIWLTEVFLPKTGSQSVLLLDSWSGHCPSSFQQSIPADIDLIALTIPKGTTGLIQPLDVFGFRQREEEI